MFNGFSSLWRCYLSETMVSCACFAGWGDFFLVFDTWILRLHVVGMQLEHICLNMWGQKLPHGLFGTNTCTFINWIRNYAIFYFAWFWYVIPNTYQLHANSKNRALLLENLKYLVGFHQTIKSPNIESLVGVKTNLESPPTLWMRQIRLVHVENLLVHLRGGHTST